MKKTSPSLFFYMAFVCAFIASCSKEKEAVTPPTPPAPPPVTDTVSILKNAAAYPIGIGISYDLMKNDAAYAAIVKTHFDNVTFEYSMKHGAIVRDDGSFNFTQADELVNIVTAAGLEIYGHTLVWHQNQNGNYLRSLVAAPASGTTGPNLLQNGSFEAGTDNSFSNWFTQVTGTAAASFTAETGDVNDGSRALKIVVTTPSTQAFHVQAVSDAWTAQTTKQYQVSFFAKGSGGKLRVVNQGTTYYQQHEITPAATWTRYTWNVAPTETAPQVKFHFPEGGTFYIDNVTVTEIVAGTPPTSSEIATRVDTAMKRFITNMATRYKGKVAAWDVVNEVMTDGPTSGLRTNSGTTTGDLFYWAQFLGRGYIAKAFQYAATADPNALLFINDYNLEFNNAKLDSTIALVNELKAQNVPVHGIGTQMHISLNTSYSAMVNMFRKLATTGLKVKVTELDIRINPSDTPGFTPSADLLEQQAQKYKSVVEAYVQNVPAAQRYGISVWNVSDKDSWIRTALNKNDYPTLFDATYKKKPAFNGFLQGLKTFK